MFEIKALTKEKIAVAIFVILSYIFIRIPFSALNLFTSVVK